MIKAQNDCTGIPEYEIQCPFTPQVRSSAHLNLPKEIWISNLDAPLQPPSLTPYVGNCCCVPLDLKIFIQPSYYVIGLAKIITVPLLHSAA